MGGGSSKSPQSIPVIGDTSISTLESGNDGFGGTIIDNENLLPKIKVGEKIVLRFNYVESGGIDNIAHVTLYINGNGQEELQKSQTFVRWQKFEPLKIQDNNGVLNDAKFDILSIDDTHFVLKFELILDKNLEGSDILLKTWNLERAPASLFRDDALVISKEDESTFKAQEPKEPAMPTSEDLPESELNIQPEISMNSVNAWAGFSEQSISDSEFLEKMGIKGDHIPNWFKKSKVTKWLNEGLITQQEFLNNLSFIVF